MSDVFRPGQRWFSSAEPELGLATVMRVAGRSVQLVFTGTGVVRQYALESAPLVRAAFAAGDAIRVGGCELRVEHVGTADGLLTYHCGETVHPEGELDAEQPVSRADGRMLSGRVDRGDQFELRLRALERRAAARAHPGWGILAARIELLPHQLRIAEVAAHRRPPRLLLADEVGLGKTIEAGIVLAQQIAAGRVSRALVLVPGHLVNQWLVELLRRFNLAFSVFDAERVAAIEGTSPRENPFEAEQTVIAGIEWLADEPRLASLLVEAGWDMLLVDEAHHLEWHPQTGAGAAYAVAADLAATVPAVLLLSATPEQLGIEGHFARLRLLDPLRYRDLAGFEAEVARYVRVSAAIEGIRPGQAPDHEQVAALVAIPGIQAQLDERLARIAAGDGEAARELVADLVDRHGTGRVMLRNRRASIGGFPQRVAHLDELAATCPASPIAACLRDEFAFDAGLTSQEPAHDYLRDPRMDWLLATIERIAPEKALVICSSRAKVQALEDALRSRTGVAIARFHEDMPLLQCDRNAAWFADPGGARLLLASEAGAEGRNFQFAQHLVFWDLPLDPDRLEQRIGRLDRIGRSGSVNLHAAAVAGSPQWVLQRWYDGGLAAFESVVADGHALMLRFRGELLPMALDEGPDHLRAGMLDGLLERTRACHAEFSDRIARGRDRLLELASARGTGDDRLLQALRDADTRDAVDLFPLQMLESFGIHHEEQGDGLWRLDPEYQAVEGFAELKGGPRTVCLDRSIALRREDALYLRDDHPMILAATEMLLSSELGNAAFLIDELPPRTVYLEAVFMLECVAPPDLDAGRFLPPTPLRAVVDARLKPSPEFRAGERALRKARERGHDLEPQRKLLGAIVPPMLAACTKQAEHDAALLSTQAARAAAALLDPEIARTAELSRINPAVRDCEVEALRAERDALVDVLPRARLRLDSLRLVAGPDFLGMRR